MAPLSAGQDARTALWPALTLSEWEDTRVALHLWTQIVGKIRLGLEPMVNHWWQVTLYVSARGLTTSPMPAGGRALEIEFDFIDQVLDLRTSDGRHRRVPLAPGTVAEYYGSTMAAVADLGVAVKINTMPSEIADAVPFTDDHQHRAYDADWARRYWTVLVQADRLLDRFRGRFIGKASPVHYFWGGADEGSFYAYAYPAPDGFADWPVQPSAAHYDADQGLFVLPYEAGRTADDPDVMVLDFCQSTYEAAAELARWDRAALEA